MKFQTILCFIGSALAARSQQGFQTNDPACKCVQTHTCARDSPCYLNYVRNLRTSGARLTRKQRNVLKDYGTGECLDCSQTTSDVYESTPQVVYAEAEPQYVYQAAPYMKVEPVYERVVPKKTKFTPTEFEVPLQYVTMPSARYVDPAPRYTVSTPRYVQQVPVEITPTRSQERKIRRTVKQAAQQPCIQPCPVCTGGCNQEAPTIVRKITTTETASAPVNVVELNDTETKSV